MDSEHISNDPKNDHIFGSSNFYFVGIVLALGFFGQWLAQNFCAKFAGSLVGNTGNGAHRRGGFPMQLKMWILSGAAIALCRIDEIKAKLTGRTHE